MIFISMTFLITPKKVHAAAWLSDTVKPYVGVKTKYDSNLFRISNNAPSSNIIKSDFITQLRTGFAMDWRVSLQHLIIKADINQNWYKTHEGLNYLGWNTLGKWNWQSGKNLNGEIGYSNDRMLGGYSQLNLPIANLMTFESFFAKGAYLFNPKWRVRAGFSRNSVLYEQVIRQISNRTENAGDISMEYLHSAKNTMGLNVSMADGHYPNRGFTASSVIDNHYKRTKYVLTWDSIISSKTRIDGQVGYTQQIYEHLSSRNLSGVTAAGNLNWQVTGKTNLSLTSWRKIMPVNNLFATFALGQGIRFAPTWAALSNLGLSAPISYEQLEYQGNPVAQVTSLPQQKDRINTIGLNLFYTPFENTRVNMQLNHEKRNSNIPQRSYTDESIELNLLFAF